METIHVICSAESCERSRVSRGLCDLHYRRAKKSGTLPPKIRRECQVEGCERRHYARNYCESHYNLVRTYDTDTRPRCVIPHCDRAAVSRSACSRHYGQMTLYAISAERLSELISEGCDLCGDDTRLFIDHDHACCPGAKSCGKCVRGAICQHCNTGLGYFRDDPRILMAAIKYLSDNGIE